MKRMTAAASPRQPSKALLMAFEMVDAMVDAGLVTVPVVPSAAMIHAGAEAAAVSPDTARRVYAAMIAMS